jgi:hypothetical protein
MVKREQLDVLSWSLPINGCICHYILEHGKRVEQFMRKVYLDGILMAVNPNSDVITTHSGRYTNVLEESAAYLFKEKDSSSLKEKREGFPQSRCLSAII